jgi:Kef-type K+ transport system membrane component KefB
MPAFYPAFLSFNDAAAILPLLIVFASAKLLGELAEKLSQPPVVGELLAGILIGPAVLGWIVPGDLLSFVAELGVLFLMFQVGLELRDFRLSKLGLTALLVAVGGVVFPFVAGYVLTLQFGHEAIAASFVGSALVATSVGITARVLAAQGWLAGVYCEAA